MNSSIERLVMDKPIDREKNCPLLLRVFLSSQRHHQPNEFAKGQVPSNELQIYTWPDATLKELTNLVKEVNLDSRRKGTIFDFALIFPEQHSNRYRMREIGSTTAGYTGSDDEKTLLSLKFQIGDFLDICICKPSANHNNYKTRSITPPPAQRGNHMRDNHRMDRGGNPPRRDRMTHHRY